MFCPPALNRHRSAFSSKGSDRQADFITIVAWRQRLSLLWQVFKKEAISRSTVPSRPEIYTDKDGNKRTPWRSFAGNVSFVGRKSSSSPSAENYAAGATQAPQHMPAQRAGIFRS
jgi:single-strand DNA-binding protein